MWKKTRGIFSFLPLINSSVTIGLSFLLLSTGYKPPDIIGERGWSIWKWYPEAKCFRNFKGNYRLGEWLYLLGGHGTFLAMKLKGMLSICFQWSSFLVGQVIWERQMLLIITKNNKYLNSILFLTFWNLTLFWRYSLPLTQSLKI